MIVEAQAKQFTLKDDGVIYFQPDSTNPLPGDPLARVKKGESLLQPSVALIEGRDIGTESAEAVTSAVETWLKAHIYTVLEPLFALVADEAAAEPVREIALKLFAHTGIVPRGEIESSLSKLDPEMRKALRDKKVRLGPLLVFLPDLNKPAAVHLRALLWSLFNDAPLPAPIPRDGAMSSVVDVTTANPDFYRAIGYPLYGPRIVRIDMLDRVINAVYDSAKEGKFQAQHKMAEWMGCPIADLYAILEAMGHKRLETAPVVIAEPVAESVVEQGVAVEETPAAPVVAPVVETPAAPPLSLLDIMEAPAPAAEIVTTEIVAEAPKKIEQKKPDLDWFMLRRGKAHAERTERPPRPHHAHRPRYQKTEGAAPVGEGEGSTVSSPSSGAQKKPFPAERFAPKGAPKKKFGADSGDDDKARFNKKKRHEDKGRERDSSRRETRVYSAEAENTDNPFSVLQNLKLK